MTRTEAVAEQQRLFPRRGGMWSGHPTLPEICLDLRSALNGAADPWDYKNVLECRNMLRARLDTWAPEADTTDGKIDRGVYIMVLAAICAANEWLLANQPRKEKA